MFYLLAFLTLLMSILIYSMDPFPTRREMETREGEAYVVGFINQHQAAKDYMYRWLGRVRLASPASGVKPDNRDFANQRAPLGATNPVAMSLFPYDLENFLPRMLVSEVRGARANLGAPTRSSFVSMNAGNEIGYYKSVVVSLTNAGALGDFYVCHQTPGSVTSAECTSTTTNISWLEDAPGKKYVITYGDPTDPDIVPDSWWNGQGNSLAVRKQLWRRAVANRTRASIQCGVLFISPEGKRWIRNPNQRRGDFIILTNGDRNYCFDDGYKCNSILPTAIETFLKTHAYVNKCSGGSADCLDDTFLCMSEIKNPYVTSGLAYHFDSIDVTGLGAPWDSGSFTAQPFWSSRTGGRGYQLEPVGNYTYSKDGNDVQLGYYFNNPTNMPFQKQGGAGADFTLSFVMRRESNGGTGCIIGPCGQNQGFYFSAVNPQSFVFGLGDNRNTVITTDAGGVPAGALAAEAGFVQVATAAQQLFSHDIHHWTVIQRSGNMEFYLDGQPLNTGNWPSSATGGGNVVTFGQNRVSGTYFLNIQYYNRALSRVELLQNVKVDVKRYGVTKNIDVSVPVPPPGP